MNGYTAIEKILRQMPVAIGLTLLLLLGIGLMPFGIESVSSQIATPHGTNNITFDPDYANAFQKIPSPTKIESTINVSFSELSFSTTTEKNVSYDKVEIHGYSSMTNVGEPVLPMKNIQILIPPDARFDNITITSYRKEELPGTYKIYPAQHPGPPVSNPYEFIFNISEIPFVEPNQTVYSSDQPYPGVLLDYLDDGYLAGHQIVIISTCPLQYVPSTGKLTLYKDIKFEVNYKPSISQAVKVERRSKTSQRLYDAMVKSLIGNPSDIKIFSPDITIVDTSVNRPFELTEFPSTCGSIVEYVIITDSPLHNEFQELADWKTKKGVPTVVRNVSWIEANFPGCDLQEKIRNFIGEAYSKWGTQCVLLGGDTDIIPDRKAEWPWYDSCNIPTDLYYSDLDRDWNGDGDAYFGESSDNVDLLPDLFVGRAPVGTSSEVATFVDKIFTYEKNPDLTYITKALLMAVERWRGQYTKDYIANNYIPGHIGVWKLYETGGNALLNRDNVLNCMNEGYHFINHIDHSGVNFMGTCIWCRGGNIGREHMDSLTNDGKFSILWSMGCDPNAFDHDSISEHFILNPSGGGVAFIGNTRAGYCGITHGEQCAQDEQFFAAIFNDAFFGHSQHHIGMAFASTQGRTVASEDQYSYLMNLLGDPEMPVWTVTPTQMSPSIPIDTHFGINVVTINVGVPYAKVCLYKEGEIYAYGETGLSGSITFIIRRETWGSVHCTITAQNYLPYEGDIPAGPEVFIPYLRYATHMADDDNIGPSSGNGDGAVDAGEVIELFITIKETRGGAAAGVSATLSLTSPDAYINILDGTAIYGDIGIGGTATNPLTDPYIIQVLPNCPDEHKVEFNLEILDDVGRKWKDEFTICVVAPNLWHSRNVVCDITWPNGVIDPGETVDLSINVTNGRPLHNRGWVGHGAAPYVTAILTTSDPYVTITQASVNIGDILPREEKMSLDKFSFAVSSSWPGYPDNLDFVLTMTDSHDRSWSHLFELTPPEAPTGLRAIPEKTSIKLTWSPNTESDLVGSNIYLLGSGTKVFWGHPLKPPKLNTLPVTSSCYTQTNLASGTGFEYGVAAVDSSGNEGESSIIREWTNPKDQPGWPKKISPDHIESSPAIADLDGNSANGLEIVVGSFWDGRVYAWHHNGVPVSGWPNDTGGWPNVIYSSPAIGDIDNDGDLEVVIGAGNKVYAWHHNGNPVSGWPITVTGSVISTTAIENVDHTFSGLEIVVTTSNGWVYVFRNDGNLAAGSWPVQVGNTGMRSSPAVGDIDGDGKIEIVVVGQVRQQVSTDNYNYYGKVYALNHDGSSVANWPVDMDGYSWNRAHAECAPVLGDIDNDGDMEIIAQDRSKTYVWHHDGTRMSGWPKSGGNLGDCSPAIGDLDDDGDLEIVVESSNKKVYAWHHNGDPVNGWPQETKCGAAHNPIIGDIDGDGEVEILVGSDNEKVYAWHSDGTRASGWPVKTGWLVWSTPTLGDIDLDGDIEVAVGSHDENVYVWDCDCAYKIEWGTFRRDVRRTGFYPPVITVDDEGDGDYTSIQAAINAASPGWTITVYSGTYSENVRVWQNVILEGIPQELGSGTDTGPPVVDGSGSDVFYIESNDIVINGFIIQNGFNGICVDYGSDNVKIHDNEILSNNGAGVSIADGCDHNIINNNHIIDNGGSGISVSSSWLLDPVTNNVIIGNTIEGNANGISFFALGDMVTSGSVTDNKITDNTISNNNYGIIFNSKYWFSSVDNNIIKNNIITNNNHGIFLLVEDSMTASVAGNQILNNYFDNDKNAEDNGNNIWNIARTSGRNIIGGDFLGGNYWHDYTGDDDGSGTGDHAFANDGIGDTLLPYNCGGNIVNGGDWNPLVWWPCACEEALYRGNVSNPEEKLNSLRELRDEFLREKYVNSYYKCNPGIRTALIEEPYLLSDTADLIVKYIPAVNYGIGEGGEDLKIEEEDVKEAILFIENLKKEIWERREEIGINRSSDITEFLEEFEEQVNTSEGKTFSRAFRDSIYYKVKYVINETKYKNSITQPINVSRIRFVHNAVNEKWVKGSKWPISMELMYWQKSTKYLIEIDIEGNGNVTRVGFRRWGNPITEIPYDLAKQSLASLPPGFAIGP